MKISLSSYGDGIGQGERGGVEGRRRKEKENIEKKVKLIWMVVRGAGLAAGNEKIPEKSLF